MDENNSGGAGNGNRAQSHGIQAVVDHMSHNKVDAFLWMTRLATIVFTFLYIIPIVGNPYSCYQRALMSNAATSALRLHQRLPHVRFNREFLALLLIEDSCHYLFYSLIFLYAYPITLVMLPIFLFALLHSANYTAAVIDKLGWYRSWQSTLASLVEHQRNILRLVAFSEIFVFLLTVFLLFGGKGSLLTPFIYYRFLTLRYASRRNPYTRTVFHELRTIIESYSNRPGFPAGLRNICSRIINFVSSLAPHVPQQQ